MMGVDDQEAERQKRAAIEARLREHRLLAQRAPPPPMPALSELEADSDSEAEKTPREDKAKDDKKEDASPKEEVAPTANPQSIDE